jgi:hypothetical protein
MCVLCVQVSVGMNVCVCVCVCVTVLLLVCCYGVLVCLCELLPRV